MWYSPISWSSDQGASRWLWSSCMVLAFCRRGSVIPICLYLLVGRYMKVREGISGLRNESSKTKRTGLFQRITAAFPPPLFTKISWLLPYKISLYSGTKIRDRSSYGRLCSPRNDPKMDLGLFEIFLFLVIKDLFLFGSSFFGEQRKSKNLIDIDQQILGCYETYRPCVAEGTFCSDKEAETESKQPRFALSFTFTARPCSPGGIFDSWPEIKAQIGPKRAACSLK